MVETRKDRRWREVRDSSQSFSSDTLQGISSEWSGDTTSIQKRRDLIGLIWLQTVTNLSDYKLSDTEEFVLSHSLSFCLPPTSIKREKVFADFEVLYAQLDHHKPRSKEQLAGLKARLSDLAHAYCGSHID